MSVIIKVIQISTILKHKSQYLSRIGPKTFRDHSEFSDLESDLLFVSFR